MVHRQMCSLDHNAEVLRLVERNVERNRHLMSLSGRMLVRLLDWSCLNKADSFTRQSTRAVDGNFVWSEDEMHGCLSNLSFILVSEGSSSKVRRNRRTVRKYISRYIAKIFTHYAFMTADNRPLQEFMTSTWMSTYFP